MPPILTKSLIRTFGRCPKALFFETRPDAEGPAFPADETRAAVGRDVGAAAREEFTGGRLIDAWDPERALALTAEAIAGGGTVLFEAAARAGDLLARFDVLERRRGQRGWTLIEVKAVKEPRDEHVLDLAFQVHLARAAGLPISRAELMHLNPDHRAPDQGKLFLRVDRTAAVRRRQKEVQGLVRKTRAGLRARTAPKTGIGPHCEEDPPCTFQERCWIQVPALSVFDLPQMSSEKKWKHFRAGRGELHAVPEAGLNAVQSRARTAVLAERPVVDAAALQEALLPFRPPLTFLDFETTNPAIPRYPGTAPYQPVPFQFSCHRLSSLRARPRHHHFLHDDRTDPRPALIQALLEVFPRRGPDGPVVAYNAGFERARLGELAEAFPRYAPRLQAIAGALVDLLPVVRSTVYHPLFHGSFSIKTVAPALLGDEASYAHLAVAHGLAATEAFERMIDPETPPFERRALREALIAYCTADTELLVRLLQRLHDPGFPV